MTIKEAIHELDCNVDYTTPRIAQACKMASRALEKQRPNGKWVNRLFDLYKCSECGGMINSHPNYCPNCGADMRESEKDVCKDCYYNDGEIHAECVVCNKAESEDKE